MKTIAVIDKLYPVGRGPVYVVPNSRHIKVGKTVKLKYNGECYPYKIVLIESVDGVVGVTVERVPGIFYLD